MIATLSNAFAISIVTYVFGASLAQVLAKKHDYTISSNQVRTTCIGLEKGTCTYDEATRCQEASFEMKLVHTSYIHVLVQSALLYVYRSS